MKRRYTFIGVAAGSARPPTGQRGRIGGSELHCGRRVFWG